MSWIPLEITHRQLLEPIWKALCTQYGIVLSEYSFINNYLFRQTHHYEVLLENAFPLVKGVSRRGSPFLLPTFDPATITETKLIELLKIHPLYPIPNQWINHFDHSPFQKTSHVYQSDYLFTTEKLKELKGRKLASRRNLLHQLKQAHHLEVFPITSFEKQAAFAILKEWQKQLGLPVEQTDYFACEEAIHRMEEFDLFGKICFVDGIPGGFTIGEQLTAKVTILHFSKALHQYKGLTPFLYEDFAQNLSAENQWINLEQDLGIPALKQAKEAFSPDKLETKWWISLE